MKNLGIYIHIPFCIKKCNYCDFLSFELSHSSRENAATVVGSASRVLDNASRAVSEELVDKYLKSLTKELREKSVPYKEAYKVDSIFIGGGTPSLLSSRQMDELMKTVADSFVICNDCEITIEANPGTLTSDKLKNYRSMGINRLSMGVQSLDDEILTFMGRIHKSEDFYRNFREARLAGFDNINVDLMFAVPGLSHEIWMDTLKKTTELEPEHISFYGLQLEEGTPFFSDFEKGKWQEVTDRVDRKQYWDGIEFLQNPSKVERQGYHHYEISNGAKDGYQCRHNLKYWSLEEYAGFGLGAHSFIEGNRFSNHKSLEKYLEDPTKPEWQHKNTLRDSMEEYIFTGMRKIEGIKLREFEKRFELSIFEVYDSQIKTLKEESYIELTQDGKMRLTHKGIDFSNRALAVFV